jgi:hypothetical protein
MDLFMKKIKQNITVVKFEKTIFDFTKYQTEVTKYIKLQEQSTLWLLNKYLKNKRKNEYIRRNS